MNTVHWIWNVTGRKKSLIFVLTLIQAVAGTLDVIFALLFRDIVDSAVAGDTDVFWRYVLRIIMLVLVQQGILFVIRWLHEMAKADLENTFKQRLMNNLLRKDYASVSATHTAEWLNRMTGDASVVSGGVVDLVPGFIETIVRMTFALIMIIALDRWFASILVPGGLVIVAASHVLRDILKKLHKNIQESDGRLRIFLQERISGLMVIKAFTAESQTEKGAAEAMAAHRAARMRRNRFSNMVSFGFGTSMEGMYLVCAIYCAHGIMTGRVSYGTLTAIMQLVGQVQGPFARISGYLPRWYATTASAERLMEAEAFKDDFPPACEERRTSSPERSQRFYRESFQALALQNAGFAYPPPHEAENAARDPSMPTVLRGLTLEIRKGEFVAFTGHSGCGKSTVLKLLMCMYPLDSGERVLLSADGSVPLTPEWRGLFAWVPQGNQLMCGKLRDVLAFACPEQAGDEERLMRCLSIACADEFLPEMENGLDTLLGERGAGLSEGQMQRIAIARALFSDRPVLLMDESTSALDEKTEKRLMENLRSLKDKTVIFVTHRKAVLSACDRVIVFDEDGAGEI